MKRNNKKGFTIVELIIVIAVIAILSTVMIPALTGIVDKANESAALQQASAIYKNYLAEELDFTEEKLEDVEGCIKVDDYYFAVVKGQLQDEAHEGRQGDVLAHNAACADGENADGHCTVCDKVCVENHVTATCPICTPKTDD